MTDLPIIFSGSMVRALQAGRKTVTRRILSPENLRIWTGGHDHAGGYVKPNANMMVAALNNARDFRRIEDTLHWVTDPAPHQIGAVMAQWMGRLRYSVGDRLWVRENWRTLNRFNSYKPRDVPHEAWVSYEADVAYGDARPVPMGRMGKQRHSIFLPRWASRMTLVVTGVKVERLRDISEEDAAREGIVRLFTEQECQTVVGLEGTRPEDHGWLNYLWHGNVGYGFDERGRQGITQAQSDAWVHQFSQYKDARGSFSSLWEMIHGTGAWDANPEVVAISFAVHKKNIDAMRIAEAA